MPDGRHTTEGAAGGLFSRRRSRYLARAMIGTTPGSVIPFPAVPERHLVVGCDGASPFLELSGPDRLVITGEVSYEQAALPSATVRVGEEHLQVPLLPQQSPEETFRALQRRLPTGVVAVAQRRRDGTGLEVVLRPAEPPVAQVPHVELLIDDPVQSAARLAPNSFEIAGLVRPDGTHPSSAELRLDGRQISILLEEGTFPVATARALSAHLPVGYRGIIDGGQLGRPAILTIVRDASIVAAAA